MKYIEGQPYSNVLIEEAKLVAEYIHQGQTYDGIFPYTKHLKDVVRILEDFNYSGKVIIGGWLHDSVEDGNISYNKIKKYFGKEVAEIVYAVTDELGRNREEKKAKTYPKILANPDALAVKLADRIANIQHGGKIDMYRKEYPAFKEALFTHGICTALWNRLDYLLS